MPWRVEQIPELTGYTIESAGSDGYYLSRRNRLYHSTDLKLPIDEIGVIDAPIWRAAASRLRLGQRLLRFAVYNVVPLADGAIFVTFDRSVGLVRNGRYIPLGGLARPCRVLRSGCAVDDRGDVYFGEYLPNNDRGEIHIYRYQKGRENVEIIYTFPAGSIRHIHGIYFDEFTGALFTLTGDDDNECRVLTSDRSFAKLEPVGSGDESWRAVSILFDEDYLYYGTDAEHRANHIFRIDRKNFERESLGEVDGTVFYSKRIGNALFFATTAENAPGQRINAAAIWHLEASDTPTLTKMAEFSKDRWPAGPFLFGTINFPYRNDFEDRLYFSVTATNGDGNTYRICP